jgi:hypothetical protein
MTIPQANANELPQIINGLIDSWCGRRDLNPLRIMLPAWPMPMGLTDNWEDLRAALRHLRAMCRDSLPAPEIEQMGRAISLVEQALSKR